MIFIIDNQGTTKAVVLQEPIYQGSNNANRIILLAPIPSTNVPSASFMLPNGMTTQPYVMTYFAGEMGEDKNLNGWYLDVDYAITQYAGVVNVQFSIGTPQGTLKTYTSSFEVQQGILTLPPDQSVSGRNLYEQVLNQLAVVQGNTDSLRSEVTGEVTTLKSDIKNAQSDIDNINNKIPTKVDKMPSSGFNRVYASQGGVDKYVEYTPMVNAGAIVSRDPDGRIAFKDPVLSNEAVTKGYFDNNVISSFSYEMSDDYKIKLMLKNKNGKTIGEVEIDLPIESMVVNASYSSGYLRLELQNGNTLDVDVSDIISGLVNKNDFQNEIANINTKLQNVSGKSNVLLYTIDDETDIPNFINEFLQENYDNLNSGDVLVARCYYNGYYKDYVYILRQESPMVIKTWHLLVVYDTGATSGGTQVQILTWEVTD